jgi:hypothetical protein
MLWMSSRRKEARESTASASGSSRAAFADSTYGGGGKNLSGLDHVAGSSRCLTRPVCSSCASGTRLGQGSAERRREREESYLQLFRELCHVLAQERDGICLGLRCCSLFLGSLQSGQRRVHRCHALQRCAVSGIME